MIREVSFVAAEPNLAVQGLCYRFTFYRFSEVLLLIAIVKVKIKGSFEKFENEAVLFFVLCEQNKAYFVGSQQNNFSMVRASQLSTMTMHP